ncbi:MAG: class I SAM-dependent methyltransferase [Myxococcota bacterium]
MTSEQNRHPIATRDARFEAVEPPGCRLCGGEVAFALRARDRTRSNTALHDYVACVACGSLQLERLPADPERAYGPTYYTRQQRLPATRVGGWLGWRRVRARFVLWAARRPSLRPFARAVAGRRYGRFEWFVQTATRLDDPILDVGCGSGRLLLRMAGDGFRCLVGIDPALSEETLARVAGRPGLRFERAGPEGHAGTYHLVMAHHSFEHMLAPQRAFAAMAARVAPGGWLLLRVPLAEGEAFERDGAEWAQLDAPRHLQIPTRRAVERLAREQGLVVARIVDDSGPFQLLGSGRARHAGLAAWGPLRALVARWRARALRRAARGDQAAFYLRRPEAPRSDGVQRGDAPQRPGPPHAGPTRARLT